jgi:hypothetical protein
VARADSTSSTGSFVLYSTVPNFLASFDGATVQTQPSEDLEHAWTLIVPGVVMAVVPARAGSKRIGRVGRVGGMPLFPRTVLSAVNAQFVDQVVVSTASQQYAPLATSMGADVPFLRLSEFAADSTSIIDVLTHLCNELGHNVSLPE